MPIEGTMMWDRCLVPIYADERYVRLCLGVYQTLLCFLQRGGRRTRFRNVRQARHVIRHFRVTAGNKEAEFWAYWKPDTSLEEA